MRGEVAVRLFTMCSNRLTQGLTQKLKGKRCDTLVKCDRWAELYWMKQIEVDLTPDEERELEALEGENMKTIEKVYEAIKADRAIMSLIERIKSHGWVGVIEGGI